jgi:hypothetical protein
MDQERIDNLHKIVKRLYLDAPDPIPGNVRNSIIAFAEKFVRDIDKEVQSCK